MPPLHRLLPYDEWRTLETEHERRVHAATVGHRERRLRGEKHAIEDFLFTYYPFTVGALTRWHPGAGVGLLAQGGDPASFGTRASWRFYRTVPTQRGPALAVDLAAYRAERGSGLAWMHRVLSRTLESPARLGCFGLHEWAMVYGLRPGEQRHENLPLRLSHDETDAVVRAASITCTHFDAFRFFTPPARGLNLLQPTREKQADLEQPGCLHAGMDLYKWGTKLLPTVASDLVMDAFDLARAIRRVDMQASPYDVSRYDVPPICIETPAGRAEYVRRQREFAERGNSLRERYLAEPVFAGVEEWPDPPPRNAASPRNATAPHQPTAPKDTPHG